MSRRLGRAFDVLTPKQPTTGRRTRDEYDEDEGEIRIPTRKRTVSPSRSVRGRKAVLKGVVTKQDIINQRLSRKPYVSKTTGKTVNPKSGEEGKGKTQYQVNLGGDKNVEIFKSKANASKYAAQNMPYFGTAAITRLKETKSGVTIAAKKRDPTTAKPRAPSAYQQYSKARWAEIKQAQGGAKFQKGEVQSYMRQIGQYWRQDQANGSAPLPKAKPKGSGMSMKAKWAIAKANPSAYQKTGKKGAPVCDTAKVGKITRSDVSY